MIVKRKDSGNGPGVEAISSVLTNRNRSLPWVARALDPNAPTLKNQDGSVSTNRLAAEQIDGKWYVFPTLDYDQEKRAWVEFDDPFEAYEYHKKKGTLMEAPSKQVALYYAENGLIKH